MLRKSQALLHTQYRKSLKTTKFKLKKNFELISYSFFQHVNADTKFQSKRC